MVNATTIKYFGFGVLLTLIVATISTGVYLNYFAMTDDEEPNTSGFDWNFASGLTLSSQLSERSSDLLEIRSYYGEFVNLDNGWAIDSDEPELMLNTSDQEAAYNDFYLIRRYDDRVDNSFFRFNRWNMSGEIKEFTGYTSNNSIQSLHHALVDDMIDIIKFEKVWDREIEDQNLSTTDLELANNMTEGSKVVVIEHRYKEGSYLKFHIFKDPRRDHVQLQLLFFRYENFQIDWQEDGYPGAGGSDVIQESVEMYHGQLSALMPNYLNTLPQVLHDIYLTQFAT